MVTIGDVLAIIATLIGIGVTTWALMVTCALLFPSRVEMARVAAGRRIWTSLGQGLLVLLPGLVGLILAGQANPVTKFVGVLLLLAVLSMGAVGAAGLAQVAGRQIQKMAPEMGEYPAFVRGGGFLVTACMLPILGWLAFAPVILLVSFAAGARAVLHRNAPPVIASNMV